MQNTLKTLHALGDENRLRIINLLFDRDLCVCTIMNVLGLKQSNASRHLNVLKEAGLIRSRKAAQWVYHSACREELPEWLVTLITGTLRAQTVYQSDLQRLTDTPDASCGIRP